MTSAENMSAYTMKAKACFMFIWAILLFPHVQSAVYKIDVTVRQIQDQFVDLDSNDDTTIWAFLPYQGAGNNVTFNIGRTSYTGTGAVGGVTQPSEDTLPDSSGFPPGSSVAYEDKTEHSRMKISLKGSPANQVNHIGAFFVEAAIDNGNTVKITAIKTAKTATIKPKEYTKTVSVGDDITLEVVANQDDQDDLRWRHNSGEYIKDWKHLKSVQIRNVRKADEGIYECHQHQQRTSGVHAIMRLIVRACPSGLYGPSSGCLNVCDTCYNGGICEEETGVCVCPPGFKGVQCEQACGDNYFGAECGIICSKTPGRNCKEVYYCLPDPVGCSCQSGFQGSLCDEECPSGSYGADCKLTCHCSEGCDKSEGCNGSCSSGYTAPQCQVPTGPCQQGYFGELCQYMCHCKDFESCDKDSGACNNGGECADGWGGINNCRQALPGLFQVPTANVDANAASISVSWEDWSPDIDYGTGPVEKYKVHYGKGALTDSMETSESQAVLSNLTRGPTYHIAISAFKNIEDSSFEGNVGEVIKTDLRCIAPTLSPEITDVIILGSDSVQILWEVPEGENWIGCDTGITEFTIMYNKSMQEADKDVRDTTIYGLQPCSTYLFRILASNSVGNGPMSDPEVGNTEHATPGTVKSLHVTSSSASSLDIKWDEPDIASPCWISSYTVSYKLTNLDGCEPKDELIKSVNSTMSSLTIEELQPHSKYSISVYARSEDVPGEKDSISAATNEDVPSGAPTNLQHNTSVKQQITLHWNEPQCGKRHGNIRSYDYKFGKDFEENDPISGSTYNLSAKFEDLTHYTEYKFQVRANTSAGAGPFTELVLITTAESNPDAAPINIEFNKTNKRELKFSWEAPPPENRNGVIILYEYEFGQENMTPNRNVTDITYVLFQSLEHNTFYEFRVSAKTSAGSGPYSEKQKAQTLPPDNSENPKSAIVAASVSIAVLVIAAVILLSVALVKRRRKNVNNSRNTTTIDATSPERNNYSTPMQCDDPSPGNVNLALDLNVGDEFGETSDHATSKPKPKAVIKPTLAAHFERDQPIKIEDFIGYVKAKKLDAHDHELPFDFKALPDKQQSPWTVAKKSENTKKNRYINIIAYDHSRVHLDPLEGDVHSDYINASYIDGYNQPNAYIASQGPNAVTINDMWRMIWQEKSQTIIMATNLIEGPKKKCDKYWPDKGKSLACGKFIVTNVGEEEFECYTFRSFTVAKDGIDNDKQDVKQFHFTGWPDMQAPEFAAPVLQMLEQVNAFNPPHAGPVVVHCSAGVGRTGTFIAIDVMLKMAKAEGKLDIFNFITKMRTSRIKMIQTEVQYEFIHDALLEGLFCGKTTIPTTEIGRNWNTPKQDKLITGQHEALDATFPAISQERCSGGRRAENTKKNRYPDKIPPDSARPYLMSIDGNDHSNNYINAAFCNGYGKNNMYLATQVPLPNTVGDFWCMIYDYECQTIVALNDPMKADKTCGYYWPDDESITCGKFTILSNGVEQGDNVIERKLKYYNTRKQEETRTVTLIQYTSWPIKNELPKSAESFLQLLNYVEKSRRDSGDQRMAVVCQDGVTRCGLLCAVMSIIDKIKEEQLVDVFQAVKRLRVSRYEMVHSLDQYKFCYEMARVYLQAFETYSNFAS